MAVSSDTARQVAGRLCFQLGLSFCSMEQGGMVHMAITHDAWDFTTQEPPGHGPDHHPWTWDLSVQGTSLVLVPAPGDAHYERVVRILLECFLVLFLTGIL